MPAYRFQALRAFVTYAQANGFSKADLYEFLEAFTLNEGVDQVSTVKVCVGQEQHDDGGQHFHCFIEFSRKVHERNPRFLDFRGCHPNIQAVKSVPRVLKYITKEDEHPLANFDIDGKSSFLPILRLAIQSGKCKNDIIDEALDADPTYLRCYTAVASYVDARLQPSRMHLPELCVDDFALSGADYDRMEDFARTVATMRRGDRSDVRSMWWVGPSRYGKTSLARSIGRHWYMQSSWSIDNFCDNDGLYGVLDDIPWDGLKYAYKSLLGCQKDVTWTDKYRSKKTFKFGYPVIVVSNHLPTFTEEERSWLSVNVDFYQFNDSAIPNEDREPIELEKLDI